MIRYILLALLIAAPGFAAQQTVNNGETMGQARTKINENFTEVYGSISEIDTDMDGSVTDESWFTTIFSNASMETDFASVAIDGSDVATALGNRYTKTEVDARLTGGTVEADFASLSVGGDAVATTASELPIVDSGGYFTGTDAEAVLQEVGASLDAVVTTSNIDSAIEALTSLDLSLVTTLGLPSNVILEADVDDTPVDSATTAPVSSNWAYDHAAATDPHGVASATLTLTNKTISYSGTGNDITMPLNGALDGAITDPVDADDMIYARASNAMTLTDIYCIAEGGGTITLTIQECSSAGAGCADIEGAITCDSDGAEDDGSLTDGAIASGAWLKVLFGAPSGTVTNLQWSISGYQTW